MREVIALAADRPDEADDEVRLDFVYQTGDVEIDVATEQLRHLRAQTEAASRELAARTSELARRLVTKHRFSVREAATLLAVSPARVDQIVRSS
ncbi:MAG TPA: hypothetical protein VF062_25300 [Candidatus Limnocylindrales bacterium]